MDIQGVQQQLREFAADRDWQAFHSPKNLAMALMVEAAELLEIFQWLTTEQSHTLTRDAMDKERVADEIADVFLYLLQIADKTGVDVEHAVQTKMGKNAQKYPSKFQQLQTAKPKVHVLVDWENVQPDAAALKQLCPESTDIWLFHNPGHVFKAQKLEEFHQAYGCKRVTPVARTGEGKNALDFQLSYYAGYLMARQPEARFVVVSNDKGYDPMLTHACTLEFNAQRLRYEKPKLSQVIAPALAPAPAPAPKAADAQQVAATQKNASDAGEGAKKIPKVNLPVQPKPADKKAKKPPQKTSKQQVASVARKVHASLRKMVDNKPGRNDGLLQLIRTHISPQLSKQVAPEQIRAVLQSQQVVKISKAGAVSYPSSSAPSQPHAKAAPAKQKGQPSPQKKAALASAKKTTAAPKVLVAAA